MQGVGLGARIHINPAPAGPPWKCNCKERCKGVLRKVSKRRYDAHTPFRVRPEDVLHPHQPLAPIAGGLAHLLAHPPGGPHAGALDVDMDSSSSDSSSSSSSSSDSDSSDPDEPANDEGPPSRPVRDDSSASPSPPPVADMVFYPGGDDDDEEDPRPDTPPSDPEYGYTEDLGVPSQSRRKEVRETHTFIRGLQNARLKDSGLSAETLARMSSPPRAPAENLTPADRAGLRMFCARGDASEENYADNRAAFEEVGKQEIPTYDQVKRLASNLTGIDAIHTDMCVNTCLAYIGPFAVFEQCPFCGESRYDAWKLAQGKQVARRTFQTYPLGPQLQAMWSSPETATLMKHRARETRRILDEAARDPTATPAFDDVYYGESYLAAVQEEERTRAIKDEDMVLMFSIDGAQLYESKASDCWFSVWVVFDLPPDSRYKKRFVLPGAVIGGPKKPKNIDSFLYPGLHHLAALQREGLEVWDASEDRRFKSFVYLLLATADGPAMAYLNGLVGHQGAHGCRLYCPFLGRNKIGGSMYYPAALQPHPPEDGDHPDVPLRTEIDDGETPAQTRQRYEDNLRRVEQSPNNAAYARNRLQTGIAKPSIFSGLPRSLGIPDIFGADLMHLISLNLTDLVLSLLRGTLVCEAPDSKDTWDWAIFRDKDLWAAHGQLVAEASHCLPGSFDRPPRNPAEKISSGYKAWEYLLYVYGLLPGLLRGIQRPLYYKAFCKLVRGIRIVLQRRLPDDQLLEAHVNLVLHVEAIETLYYARHRERLNHIRQSLHALTHIIQEVHRRGPGTLYTQWTLENYIGNITREIKQHSTPYANVSERALRRTQVNAIKAMIPALAENPGLPRGAHELSNGYILLRAMDSTSRRVSPAEESAILEYLVRAGDPHPDWTPLVRRWARVRLPNGQVARTAWKECLLEMRGRSPRRARMVKLTGEPSRFVEVQYFFLLDIAGIERGLAMIAPFSAPDPAVLVESENTVPACTQPGDDAREVVDIITIASVVAMVPLPMSATEAADPRAPERYGRRFFVVEKPGLDVALLGGREEPLDGPGDDADDE